MNSEQNDSPLPPLVLPAGEDQLDALLGKEWLLGNRVGAYASSTAAGCNTRRYHGLLVAAALPPTRRIVALSTVMEYLTLGETTWELATNEFAGTFAPRGIAHLAEFRLDTCPTFVYRLGQAELVKKILPAESENAVAVHYTLRGASGTMRVWPFTPLRDYHRVRKVHEPNEMTFEILEDGVAVRDRRQCEHEVRFQGAGRRFFPKPQWWYRFNYRMDLLRGQDGFEDLYTPGWFEYYLTDGQSCQFTASLDESRRVDFDTAHDARRRRREELAVSAGPQADIPTRRLAAATDLFVVQRDFPNARSGWTILAGHPWFADWGRDAFIALPGLLLATGRFEQARGVFRTFAEHIRDGLVPNRFDDYSASAHYNSIDASLWFVLASERYVRATGDEEFWLRTLQPAAHAILSAYRAGTQFDIGAGPDGLLHGGSTRTQLTWMDAALGEEVVTPRHGKAVEVNALWYCAHRILAERCEGSNPDLARQYAAQADLIGKAFAETFWYEQGQYLYDCVNETGPDASLRPNQIFAVSLPHSPLPPEQQAAVVRAVAQHLLTPMGLRTLSPFDPRYRRRYGGSWESRDRAYHQGTVWAWLIGPFVEAHLRVNADRPLAVEQAREMLAAFDEHLHEAALGFISEIFDAEPPHTPRGCVAQAWSVAEVLRAKLLVREKAGK